ncbi:MAG: hypothetical protein ACJ8M1_02845 [Chthoniobacterales bacterium]
MAVFFRVCLFASVLLLQACVKRDEARNEVGLVPEEGSNIPQGTPRVGYERIKTRPDATPTPPPTDPMDKPLDPTGLPSGR